MTKILTAAMNESNTAPPKLEAIAVSKPNAFTDAVLFVPRDITRFKNILAIMAEKLEEKGVFFSSLAIRQTENGTLNAEMGLFDKKGRETTLALRTYEGGRTRNISIIGETSEPGAPYNPPYSFQGGNETWQPSHWRRDPADKITFHNRETGTGSSYRQAFDDYKLHSALAGHLADKTVRGFIHDVDHARYRENVREETPKHDVRARRYHFPKTQPSWTP